MDHDKVSELRSHFEGLLGSKIIRLETAELLFEDGTWGSWPDLPVRIYTNTSEIISISWSNFDTLWLSAAVSLPFSIEGSTVQWVENAIEAFPPAIGATIRSVKLGQGQMTFGETKLEIWTRLLIEVDTGWLEIFNALDENGYEFHREMPAGNFVPCL